MALLKATRRTRVLGPYFNKGIGRYVVHIKRGDQTTTRTYARWLLEEHLGRPLRKGMEADHINDDPLDDRIENLQELARPLNARKSRPERMLTFVCPACGTEQTKNASRIESNRRQGKAGPFCGKSCARQWQLRAH